MTSYGKTVLWLGLFLIVLNAISHWSDIRTLLFSTSASSSDQTGSNATKPAGAGSGFGIHIPGLPGTYLPGFGGLFPEPGSGGFTASL